MGADFCPEADLREPEDGRGADARGPPELPGGTLRSLLCSRVQAEGPRREGPQGWLPHPEPRPGPLPQQGLRRDAAGPLASPEREAAGSSKSQATAKRLLVALSANAEAEPKKRKSSEDGGPQKAAKSKKMF